MPASRADRLAAFRRRLRRAPQSRSFDEAYGRIQRILNEVEDRLSGIPYNIEASRHDGRLYPPLWDNTRRMNATTWSLRSARHRTLVGENGAIEIVHLPSGQLELEIAGEDGRKVSDL